MDASGKRREIGRTSITPIRKVQGKNYSSDTLGVALIRDLKAAAARSTPLSSAQKWTARRAVNCTPSSCRSVTKIASSSSKSVFLHDWWLINADGNGLAIGGFTYINERKTLFRSAVTVKRHDAVTLETKDGMTVLIGGNINMQHSLGNGFSREILNRFMIGFPCDWEEYTSVSTKPFDKPSSCPVSNESVLMMQNMYEDLQRQLGKTPERASVDSKIHHIKRATANGVVGDEFQSKHKLPEGSQVEELNSETSGSATKTAVEKEQTTAKNLNATANNVFVSRRQIFTRSMTKVKTLTND